MSLSDLIQPAMLVRCPKCGAFVAPRVSATGSWTPAPHQLAHPRISAELRCPGETIVVAQPTTQEERDGAHT